MLSYHQRCSLAFTWQQFHKKCLWSLVICNMFLEITPLELLPHHSEVNELTHWDWVIQICISKLTIFGSDSGLSPSQHQAIIWTNAKILLIWNLGTNFNEILTEIHTSSFKKIYFKMSSAKWRQFCLGLNVLKLEKPKTSHSVNHAHKSWDEFWLHYLGPLLLTLFNFNPCMDM